MTDSAERYSRQVRLPEVGAEGQRRLSAGRVLLVGCGALGTVIADALVRAGVGFLRVVDRDFVELNNLQRQILFDEADAREGLPKAEAGARKLRAANSSVAVEPVVAHVEHGNVLGLAGDADVVVDGTDNFEVRYLLNDAAVKLGKPWIYGGCVGTHGQTLTIVPGRTPCLRCLFEETPAPGESETCETAGVLGPAVHIVASLQAVEALKLLLGREERISRELAYLDVWENTFRRFQVGADGPRPDCPCCGRKQFDWLDGRRGSQTTTLCGRNAVQVAPPTRGAIDLAALARALGPAARPTANRYLLRFEAEGRQFTVFPDGRAIIHGTDDADQARTLYARYVGH